MASNVGRSEHFVAMAEAPSQHRRRRSTQIPLSPLYNTRFPAPSSNKSSPRDASFPASTSMKLSLSDEEHTSYYTPQWRTTVAPVHFIRRHACAVLGWLLSLSLLFTLLYSVPTLPQHALSRIQSLRRTQPVPPAIQGTTIVSAFYALDNGKKHRIEGES